MMNRGTYPCIQMDLPKGTTERQTRQVWINFLKAYKPQKIKTDKKPGEVFADDVYLPKVSENTVDVYTHFLPNTQGPLTTTVWFNLGGAYLSPEQYPQSWSSAEQFMQYYYLMLQRTLIEQALKKQQKESKTIIRTIERLTKKQRKLEKAIQKAQKAIEAAQHQIKANRQEQQAFLAQKAAMEKRITYTRSQLKLIESQLKNRSKK